MAIVNAKKREKLLAVITGAIITATFLFTAVIDPQLERHKSLLRDLSELELELTKAQRNLVARERVERAYSQIEPLIAGEGSLQQQKSGFTRLLDEICSQLSFKNRLVRILPVAEEEYYRRLSIRVEMTGQMSDFLKFVRVIEERPEPIKIEQLELAAQESKDIVRISVVISKIVAETQSRDAKT
jgi:Tfp pilus assembly protein PilO